MEYNYPNHFICVKRQEAIMEKENYEKDLCIKLAQFRTQKNVSARKMSLDLGFSDSYINKIENGKTLPGMSAFFHMCYYLNIEPKFFFDDEITNPIIIELALKSLNQLNHEQQERILCIINDTLLASKTR
jgi:transcriptional regulator with XRE-family HTH domain